MEFVAAILEQNMEINISLKTNNELDSAIAYLKDNIIYAATQSTPSIKITTLNKTPAFIKDKIRQKRKIRRIWQRTRHPEDKNKLNRATDELKKILKKDKYNRFQYYLSKLGISLSTNYSLWKAIKKLTNSTIPKPPNTWAR